MNFNKVSVWMHACLIYGLANLAAADLQLNEIMFDPIHSFSDQSNEYVEISGSSGESLADTWLVALDNNGNGIGSVYFAIDLSPATAVGTNGLLLVRSSADPLAPASDPATTFLVASFGSEMPNTAMTFLLVTSTVDLTAFVTIDLDTNDDGDLETVPWDGAVLDAVFIQDGDDEPSLAVPLGGVNTPDPSFVPMYAFRNPGDSSWHSARVTGVNGGPFTIDAAAVTDLDFALQPTTPGSPNAPATPVSISGYEID